MSREMPVWFDEFVELGAAARTSVSAHEPADLGPVIGSTTDPACCAWCGRELPAGRLAYCGIGCSSADKTSADFE